MQELMSLKDFRTGSEILTIAELDDQAIERARVNGWTLCAVFTAERKPSRYGDDKPTAQLFGVYSLPTDKVLAEACERANKLAAEKEEAQRAIWKSQEETKRSFEAMMQAKNELESLRLTIQRDQEQAQK